ncbi:hypothetical protein SAMN04488132_11154 [Sediminibacterium ginsengisoli]|uniref:Peptidase C39-like domain-containing protein n=2 Tax=Sediminibacterium ginsengisoli TaxID=413434 RepID=A0A1T4R9R8_9BACT|nr:hypothetical protein SAMN04488132_11154 [Sediminibacterium ginsengisoli]
MLERATVQNTRIFKKCIALILCICMSGISTAQRERDTSRTSTRQDAIAFISRITELPQSAHWPNIKPALFLQNLKNNIENPLSLHEGNNTNFCAYAAMSYIPLQFDPLGFAKDLLQLYREGKVKMGRVNITPSSEVKLAAGRLAFKGELDIRPADQMWFLALADHFKCYLNIFDKHFDMGDENSFWAATSFGKFNHMIRSLFRYRVEAKGSDLIRPTIDHLYGYLKERVSKGTVALFVNNMSLYQKDHRQVKPGVGTHFIILKDIEEAPDGRINITYWDYGGLTLQQVTPSFLYRLIFGITFCTKRTANAPQ